MSRAGANMSTRPSRTYKEALKADPGSAAISDELAEFYVQAGLLSDAESDAEKALAKDPKDLGALRLLARIYTSQIGGQNNRINQDMLKKAIEQYQKITDIAPKDVDAWVMLGRLEKAAQDNAEAERAYKKALEVDPDNEDALTGLSLVYLDLGNSQAAADTLKTLAEKNPSARSLQALAETYEQMKEFGLAADALKKALALNPPNAAEVKQALAQDLIYAQRYPEALQIYQDLVADDPSDAQSYLRMSQIYRTPKKVQRRARRFRQSARHRSCEFGDPLQPGEHSRSRRQDPAGHSNLEGHSRFHRQADLHRCGAQLLGAVAARLGGVVPG